MRIAFSPLWAALEMDAPDPDHEAALRRYGREAVIERHDKLEGMVGDGPFLLDERPSLADAVLVGVARWLEYHQVAEIGKWPRIAAIRRHLEADAAVIRAVALEEGRPAPESDLCLGHLELADVIRRFGAPPS